MSISIYVELVDLEVLVQNSEGREFGPYSLNALTTPVAVTTRGLCCNCFKSLKALTTTVNAEVEVGN